MRTFAEILDLAAARKGAPKVLAAAPVPKTADELAAIPDRDWLAAMARGIFQAGISWKVVGTKWPGIEEAFQGFDVGRVSMLDEDAIDALLSDTRVIRSGPKILAIRDNAAFIREVAAEVAVSAARSATGLPDYAGLIDWLAKKGSRLGGSTGPYMLRAMGKDSWILSDDVVKRLVEEGVIDGPPTSRKAMAAVQAAFDRWRAESGQGLTTISRVLAQSIG
ncbi:MAG: DNA-3-methyladenine glycosylase I [Exiguobacterium profundum]|nr:MAG: DNA-3-methyladenine glycosylase I [Exiguobacterium profundum]